MNHIEKRKPETSSRRSYNLLIIVFEFILWVRKIKRVRHLKMKLVQRTDCPNPIITG